MIWGMDQLEDHHASDYDRKLWRRAKVGIWLLCGVLILTCFGECVWAVQRGRECGLACHPEEYLFRHGDTCYCTTKRVNVP